MLFITFGCYAAGGLLSFLVTRKGTPSWWGHAIRAQFLVAGITLAVSAGWKFEAGSQFLEALGLAATWYLITLVSVLARRQSGEDRSLGTCVLEAWVSAPNTGYWGIPIATLLVGPAGTVVAVLADALLIPMNVWGISRLRRNAPIAQHAHTTLFDYAGAIGFVVGLGLNVFVPAPHWVDGVLRVVGTFLAFVGAAIWVGSVRFLLARLETPTREGWQRYFLLSATRLVVAGAVVAVFWGTPAAPIAILYALTIPTFLPPSFAVLYGYHSHVTGIASRWTWVLAPFGFLFAWLASRAL